MKAEIGGHMAEEVHQSSSRSATSLKPNAIHSAKLSMESWKFESINCPDLIATTTRGFHLVAIARLIIIIDRGRNRANLAV